MLENFLRIAEGLRVGSGRWLGRAKEMHPVDMRLVTALKEDIVEYEETLRSDRAEVSKITHFTQKCINF